MKKLLSSLFILLLFMTSVIAQERIVTGTVKGKDDGLPLPGVSVRLKGSTTGTQTGANGQFSIRIPGNNAVLVFTYIGYASQDVAVGSRSTVNVTLGADANQLTEVVVTALGIERQKKELGYAATTVSEGVLTQANAVNVANGLQGKVSGLNITGINTSVGDESEVRITMRGIRSLTGNNDPLLVIDGVPTTLNYLQSVNPNDIQNVSVLKGSSSAAIYGPDARNGVILVTTKKGSEDKPVITLSNATQFSSVSFFPKLQTQFGSGGSGAYTPFENWSWGPAFDGLEREIGHELPDGSLQKVKYSPTNDRKEFFNTGVTMQNDVSLSSKDFYLSIQDALIKGIVPDDENRRTGARLNASKEYGKFRAGLNINYIQNNYKVFWDEGQEDYFTLQKTGGNDGLMSQIFNTPAQIPLTKYKNLNDPFSSYNYYFNDYGLNPYFSLENWRKEGKRQDVLANLELNYKPADWLNFTYRAAINSRNEAERFFSRGEDANVYGEDRNKKTIPGNIEERNYNLNTLSSEIFGNLSKNINDDFKITGILGSYLRQREWRTTRVGASSLVVPELFNVENRVGNLTGSSPGYRTRLFSVYGSAGISYRGWANIEFTGRNDWTTLLAIGNNSYFYPGISGSFVLTDAVESLSANNVLSFLKLRAAWNKTGNADIDPYQLTSTFSQPEWTGFPYGSLPGFTASNTAYDYNLKPEFVNSTEVGFESGFFNSRVNIEATYFYNNNTDQIIQVRTSDATGYGFAQLNAASFINKGVELDLRLTPLVKFKDGNIQFRANATYNDSEVRGIYPGMGGELSIGGYVASGNYAIEGKPAFVIKATDYLRDEQGRIIVDRYSGMPSQDPNTKVFGRTMPKWIVGLSPSVNWKNFNLTALFEYKGGHDASFFAMGGDMAWTGVSAATARNNRERFVMPNSSYEDPANPGTYIANTSIPVNDPQSFYTGVYGDVASNFVVSAAAWRWRELSITYDLPAKFLSKQNYVKGLSLGLTGRNLFIWVPKTNEYTDPDFNSVQSDYRNTSGIVNSQSNPPARLYGFNITARF
ncbi:SusC/RagA family TonB-linked outer membrane protein [Arcticibacter tournemirensis]|uniref:SusC/RagA family TonB-linked outer membrane protein n=1 Tax=Arcticibacter tournemirensis TaxID=699437 RepID=A0A4Q0MFE5_9SPHI|nr:SusC/RagA family TonB-linked outer membrane protein [Arcticibacter tournemirensis]RXF71923.1 SusC/RagA family TonB-linked outer membrane protein [Arcticibacter tournemirensis]